MDKKFKIRGFTNCRGGGILADSAGISVDIVDVSVSGKVKCVKDCGGLIGYAGSYTNFVHVTNYADLVDDSSSREKYIGGIVGRVNASNDEYIVYASNYGNIIGSPVKGEWLRKVYQGYAGGIAGSAGNIGASFNRGNVKNASVQGGIAGKVSKAFYPEVSTQILYRQNLLHSFD